MDCESIQQNIYLFVDGALPPAEARASARHVESCASCAAAAAASEALNDALGALPERHWTAREAQAFDQAVLTRVRAATACEAGVLVPPGARRQAAKSVTRAARRHRSVRRFEPLFAPIPSLILLAFALSLSAVGAALLFGETIVRVLGSGLTGAAGSATTQVAWLSELAVERMLDAMALLNATQTLAAGAGSLLLQVRGFLLAHPLAAGGVALAIAVVVSVSVWRVLARQRQLRTQS